MPGPPRPLRLAVLQTAPVLGDVEANVRAVSAAAVDADLIVTPELSLTGYDLRDAAHDVALPIEPGAPPPGGLVELTGDGRPAILAGLVELGRDGVPYNTAVVLADGRVAHVHRKIYPPTYGLFDEGRWFGRGHRVETCVLDGWRIAVLVCEDFWHPSLVYLAALAGAAVLIVPAAAPGRGVLEGEPEGPLFSSALAWYELARVSARTHGIYVVLANRVGVENGVTFAGGSMVVGPDGTVLAAAPDDGTARIDVTLDPAEIARARRPYAHIRDEDPRILVDGVARLGTSR